MATFWGAIPVDRGAGENANPGMDGTTTWKGGLPRVSRGANSSISINDPGHPCVISKGVARGSRERKCRKWIDVSSIVVRY